MARILANDGMAANGIKVLEDAGHEVVTDKIAQDQLIPGLDEFDAVIVRSATKIRQEHMDACKRLKMIVRAGVGMDNIDVDYGRVNGFEVTNTPEASSRSVAELVMAHLFSMSRFLHQSHYEMRTRGASDFKALKKAYSKGFELKGKTIGIVGFGRIGQELAKLCLGVGMKVMAADLLKDKRQIKFPGIEHEDNLSKEVAISFFDDILEKADIISLHLPDLGYPLIDKKEFERMKNGMVLINTARGGMIEEGELIRALDSGKVKCAALDVFENEPVPSDAILAHPGISLSPHIGASTSEAQDNIALLAADKIIKFFK